jgi:hypothetical protein
MLVIRREAEAEILEAFNWYEIKRPGLGREFMAEIEAAFEAVPRLMGRVLESSATAHGHQGGGGELGVAC